MSTPTAPAAGRWTDRLPTRVGRGVHALAIASLVSQIGIIVTGGAVRLTESGLGCSEWPNCVPCQWPSGNSSDVAAVRASSGSAARTT